jgi:hypothetical protein
MVFLLVALASAGCDSGRHSAKSPPRAATTTTTTLATARHSRAEVTDIKIWSLPESPVMNWSAERGHWAAVLSLLPEQLPTPPPLDTCKIGPALDIRLRSGEDLSYECALPPSILAVRKYVLSLPPQA